MPGALAWGWDPTNKVWVPIQVDDQGRLQTGGAVNKLNDIGDVEVPSPADGDILYFDQATGLWKCKAGLAKQSACRAYMSANQTIATATWTKVNLDTESFDIQGEFNTSTYRFTAKKAGIYLVSALLVFLNPVDQQWVIIDVRKNGVSTGQACMPASGTKNVGVTLSNILSLAVDDYLELYAYQDAGVDKTIRGTREDTTFMAVVKIA
jgi:hypothetical protein